MFKTFKKCISVLLVIAMAVSAAACGGKGGGEKEQGKDSIKKNNGINLAEYTLDSDAVLATMPEELKGTELTFVIWYDTDQHEEKEVIEEFEQKTGINVTTRVVEYEKYVDTVAGLLSVGETPDVMRMKEPNMGLLKLLQPIENTGYDFSDKAWDHTTMDIYTFGDKCYGAALVNTPYHLPAVLCYNKDTMEEMGFENPWELWKQGKWTWEKFKEMCTTWVEQGTEYTGACVWPDNGPAITNGGASFVKYDENKKAYLDLNNEAAIKGWQYIEDGVMTKLFTNLNDGFDQAKQKLLFGAMSASVVQGRTVDYFSKTRRRGTFEVVPHPKWEDNSAEYVLPMMENIAFGIPKAAKNIKAVPYFLAYICNFANYDQSVYDESSNPTGFFYSEQTKECYMDMLTIEKRQNTYEYNILGYADNSTPIGWELMFKVDSSQINTWLQQRKYIFQNGIDLWNADAEKLK